MSFLAPAADPSTRRNSLRRNVLTAVSYMIPFVAAGGVLQALGLMLAGRSIATSQVLPAAGSVLPAAGSALFRPGADRLHHLGSVSYGLGSLASGLMVPVLAGYLAHAMSGRPGLMPGFTAGAAASALGAGFLGGLAGGLVAGTVTAALSRMPASHPGRGPVTILVVPLLATIAAGGAMVVLIGPPLAALTRTLDALVGHLGTGSAVLLGAVLGAMMGFDLGGPVNKVAYTFALAATAITGPLTAASAATAPVASSLLAAVMAAGMSVPLALATSVALRPETFSRAEREHAPTAAALGAMFITEGAIPFAALDPIRVIPAGTVAGAVAGAGVMATGATLYAPHGGVLALFAVGHVIGFLLALVAGVGAGAATLLLLKRARNPWATHGPSAEVTVDRGADGS